MIFEKNTIGCGRILKLHPKKTLTKGIGYTVLCCTLYSHDIGET